MQLLPCTRCLRQAPAHFVTMAAGSETLWISKPSQGNSKCGPGVLRWQTAAACTRATAAFWFNVGLQMHSMLAGSQSGNRFSTSIGTQLHGGVLHTSGWACKPYPEQLLRAVRQATCDNTRVLRVKLQALCLHPNLAKRSSTQPCTADKHQGSTRSTEFTGLLQG